MAAVCTHAALGMEVAAARDSPCAGAGPAETRSARRLRHHHSLPGLLSMATCSLDQLTRSEVITHCLGR